MPPIYPEDPNPDVRRKPISLQGGVWSTIGSLLGVLPLLLNALPADKYPWVPAATGLIGWLMNYIFVPSYTLPAKPTPAETIASLQQQVVALQKQVGIQPTEGPK